MGANESEIDSTAWRHIDLPGRGSTYACDQPGPWPGAPVVVLLHGWTATGSRNWAATMTALGERYRVIALDHRGHGNGIRSDDRFTLEDCADDAVALLDELGVSTAIFVGYSMGGPIAQLIWRRHGHRVSGLVLCATAADFTTTPQPWPVGLALDEVHRTVGTFLRSTRLRSARSLVGIHEAGRAIRRFRSTSWIGAVDVPAVVIVTERDRLVRPALQRHLAAMIPGSRTISIDGAHLVAFTQPELMASAVVAACNEIAAELPVRRRGFVAWFIGWLRRRGRPWPSTSAPRAGAARRPPGERRGLRRRRVRRHVPTRSIGTRGAGHRQQQGRGLAG